MVVSPPSYCIRLIASRFDDCFRLGKRINEDPYTLPNPEILEKKSGDAVAIPPSQHLEGATSAVPDAAVNAQLAGSTREPLTVFSEKKVVLSKDLPINAKLRNILRDLVVHGGGEVVSEVDDCDTFVCQYREGPEYIQAAQEGKDVGNLSWLYHLIVHNSWTSPLRRLLHYPIPRNGIPGFKDAKIALSNYGGEARIYLENLITAAGATYTKTMKCENTHLVTARMFGEKCDAANDWNIQTVNHLWIEDSYARCEIQALTNPKYTHFPPRTNLGEVIGQTFLDETKLHEKYYPGGDNDSDSVAKRERVKRDAAQRNIYKIGAEEGSSPIASRAGKALRGNQKPATVPKKSTKAGDAEKTTTFETPGRKPWGTGKENDTPSVVSTASRSAKAQALNKLQDLAPDLALYEKERKRSTKPGLWGGKRAADQIDKDRAAESSSPAAGVVEDEDDEDNGRPVKRQKSLPSVEMRICLTGYRRWVSDKYKEEVDRVSFGRFSSLIFLSADANVCTSENFVPWASSFSPMMRHASILRHPT
jgi:hypothetical protein